MFFPYKWTKRISHDYVPLTTYYFDGCPEFSVLLSYTMHFCAMFGIVSTNEISNHEMHASFAFPVSFENHFSFDKV